MTRVFDLNYLRNMNKDKIISLSFSCWSNFNANDVILLREAKQNSEILCVGIRKNNIQNLEERELMIESCKYVDYYFIYDTDMSLQLCIDELNPNVCYLFNDNKCDISVPVKYYSKLY